MATHAPSGYLEIILGPMFSGKTSYLVEIYKQCLFCNIPVTVVNHAIDTRYDEMLMSTHDHVKIPCVKAERLADVSVSASKVILINEGQFFPDLQSFVQEALQQQKHVYVAGLDGDFERKKFGQLLDLIPLCDVVKKLTSICSLCKDGTKGIFSLRLSQEQEQTLVGSSNYIPVCRQCYVTAYERKSI